MIELLALLHPLKPTGETNWPKSAKGMGDSLRRLSPALRTLGFECKVSQKIGGSISWEIKPSLPKVSFQCPASPASPDHANDIGQNPAGHSVLAGHENQSFEGGVKSGE